MSAPTPRPYDVVLAEYDAAPPGAKDTLMRREILHASNIVN
jgi:hypothetical protein